MGVFSPFLTCFAIFEHIFHELNEAFPSMLDENGDQKTFERFLNDVRSIDWTYNVNYLRAEYNFISASAEMAAKWEEFYPPNGWNCRCTVMQVSKSKYPATSHDDAMRLGQQSLQKDTKGMFSFNPGVERKTVPDYNPYTIRCCRDCDITKGKTKFARLTPPENQVCQLLHKCDNDYFTLEEYGDRLKISNYADMSEILPNTNAAKVLLDTFPEMEIKIREHILKEGMKNPEYEINGIIVDRKGIMGVNGVSDAFAKAKKQGCESVVIDLDMH